MSPNTDHSALQQLLELKLGQDLDAYVTKRRNAGYSWDKLAHEMANATDTNVTRVTLMNWYGRS